MARGAFLERTDYEMASIIENILDPNTRATSARKITLAMTLKPDDDRKNIAVSFEVKKTLAATNPVVTALYISGEGADGVPQVVEMTPQIPGQMNLEGGMQEYPPVLKIIR
jgi:hypothetical protein